MKELGEKSMLLGLEAVYRLNGFFKPQSPI